MEDSAVVGGFLLIHENEPKLSEELYQEIDFLELQSFVQFVKQYPSKGLPKLYKIPRFMVLALYLRILMRPF